jgi:hypothetical protein
MTADPKPPLTREDVVHMCGDIPDGKVAAIVKSGANAEELELALAWSYGEDDVTGEARLPLTGRAAQLYEILVGDQEFWEGDRQ